jgi:hypothetical protein
VTMSSYKLRSSFTFLMPKSALMMTFDNNNINKKKTFHFYFTFIIS